VVALWLRPEEGDHKGRPYIIMFRPFRIG